MHNQLKIFEKAEFGSVRVVTYNNEPWFVASDVAKALGYERPNDAVNAHCKSSINSATAIRRRGLCPTTSSPNPTCTAS